MFQTVFMASGYERVTQLEIRALQHHRVKGLLFPRHCEGTKWSIP